MSIFVGYDWFEIWLEAFGTGLELFVVVLKKHGETRAIFPCCVKPPSGDNADAFKSDYISSLTNTHTYYYDFLISPGFRRDAISCFLELLHRVKPGMHMCFESLPSPGDNFTSLITELDNKKIPSSHYSQPWAPWVESSGEWTTFYNNLSGRLKNTIRRTRKKAETIGKLNFEIIKESDCLDEALDIMFEVEYNSWKGKNGTAIKCLAEVEHFYRQLAYRSMEHGHLILFMLKLDDVPIASDFCLYSGHTVFLLKSGYDESFHHYSPGNLLRFEMFKYLYNDPGVSTYDFLGACDPWKMEWTGKAYEYGSVKVYPKSLKGWSAYMFQHGWKDIMKKSRTVRRLKAWMDYRRG
jgi:hypothetical protein